MLYDHEAILADIEAHIERAHQEGRNGLGYRELTEVIAAAKLRHRVPEGLAVRALRLYGTDLADALEALTSRETAPGVAERHNGEVATLAHS